MKYKNVVIVFFLLLLTFSFFYNQPNQTLVSALIVNFTVPTRTPTSPPQPTNTPGNNGGGGGGGNVNPTQPPAAPTNTPAPQLPTNTPTVVVFAPTPVGGYLPTAEACSKAPTITAQTLTNIRSGPGTDYSVMAELVYLEVRPIRGRAGDTNWWQISLVDGRLGWVSNSVVEYNGNVSAVPVVPAPLLNGVQPTPGVPWVPVVTEGCFPLPTWTPAPVVEETPVTSSRDEATPEPTVAQPTETAVPPTPEPNTAAQSTPVQLVINNGSQPTPDVSNSQIATAVPLSVATSNTPSSNNIFIILGGILILGIVGFAFFKNQKST